MKALVTLQMLGFCKYQNYVTYLHFYLSGYLRVLGLQMADPAQKHVDTMYAQLSQILGIWIPTFGIH